ncbi:hypothetical protein DXG01_005375 [Tephrocybe rancida]|nr:hypothetical protein DXG01_005375 [Tephrocybe rancida]
MSHTQAQPQLPVDCLLMSLPAVYESPGQSFEEIRIADYLTSYRTSGHPPLPSTSLPPFKPVAESSLSGAAPGALGLGGLGVGGGTQERITDPTKLPMTQGWRETRVEGDELQCIGAMGAFAGFSHEELRVYAYIARHKDPPPGTPMSPFVMGPSLAAQAQGTLSSSSNSRSGNGGISQAQAQANAAAGLPPTNGDQMLTISAQAQWAGHSLEELRLAYLQSGRELTSSEIRALLTSAPSSLPAPTSSLFASTSTPAPSTPTPVNPFARPLGGRLF